MKLLVALYDSSSSALKEMKKAVYRSLPSLGGNSYESDNEDDNRLLTDEEFCSLLGREERNDGIVFTDSGLHERDSSLPNPDALHCLSIWD